MPFAQLASSFMGGGDKGSTPSSTTATSGDASAGLNLDFTSNNAFTVGGSGKTSQTASSDKDQSSGMNSNNATVYIIAGIAGVAVLSVVWFAMRKAS